MNNPEAKYHNITQHCDYLEIQGTDAGAVIMTREDTPLLYENQSLLDHNRLQDLNHSNAESSLPRYYLFLMLMMGGVTGLSTVSITILADDCGVSPLKLGVVYLCQAVGSIIGSLLSNWLYVWFFKHIVLLCSGLFLAFLFFYFPSVISLYTLCLTYTLLGVFHVLVQIGCISLLRLSHKHRSMSDDLNDERSGNSGYWMALTQLCFSLGAFLMVFVFATNGGSSFTLDYAYCFMLTVGFIIIIVYMNPEDNVLPSNEPIITRDRYYNTHIDEVIEAPDDSVPEFDRKLVLPGAPEHYHGEILIGVTMLLINGVVLSISTFLPTFAEESSAEAKAIANYQVAMFWCASTTGHVIGVFDQYKLINKGNITLRISGWIIGACMCALFWFAFPYTMDSIWVCVTLIGFLSGPTNGYCLDLLQRITLPSILSTSIVIMIMNSGSLLVVFLCALIWDAGAGALTLVYVSFLALLLSTPFVWFARGSSYMPERISPL